MHEPAGAGLLLGVARRLRDDPHGAGVHDSWAGQRGRGGPELPKALEAPKADVPPAPEAPKALDAPKPPETPKAAEPKAAAGAKSGEPKP